MKFTKTDLLGAYLIEVDRLEDSRGFFARTFCEELFEKQGLETKFKQSSISYNVKKSTLRGLHYQIDTASEVKLVRCTRGAIYDVIVDLRPDSTTYMKWISVILSAENRNILYIPVGIAHGFQTLVDNTEVAYDISNNFTPSAARGIRWNDPLLNIVWPETPSVISEKDRSYSDYASVISGI